MMTHDDHDDPDDHDDHDDHDDYDDHILQHRAFISVLSKSVFCWLKLK